ncbi:PHD finger protein 14 isoform X2 [Lampetra planeri]
MPGGADGDDVAFMFKAMLERDPNKRRVKPVQNQLLEAAFGYDSSDDSDFNVDEASGSSGTDGSDAESKASESKEEKKSKDSESEDSEENGHGKAKEAEEDKSSSDSDQKEVSRKRESGAKGKEKGGRQQSKGSGDAAKKTSSGESESSDSESAPSAKNSNDDAQSAKDQKRKWNFRRKRSTPAVVLTEQDLGNMDDYDSEDDNDWDPEKVGKQGGGSESEGSDGSDEKGHGGNDDSESGNSSDKDSKGSDDGSDDEEDEDGDEKESAKSEEQESGDDVSGSESTVDKSVTIGELIEKVAKKRTKAEESVTSSKTSGGRSSQKMQEVLICSVCLGENSEDSNEIVQCDNCGVTVHEACYGVDGESESVISSTSDNSTEPWFCDPCKAGVVPSCELCPAIDGIFKETDAGRWVHVVCALYVSGVAFEDVERLRPVTLTEMSYAKYGAKECMLCEERLFSRTGVCINCDAGMCRSFFHVMCAQREGLLSEAAAEEEIADPFFAHCKQHADRMDRKWKRKNYLALQSFSRQIREEKGKAHPGDMQARIDAKLQLYRARFELAKGTRPSPWVPREKLARPLTSSASAVRALLHKAQLAGVSTDIMPADTTEPGTGDGRRKQIRHPTLTSDFVTYYLERNMQMMQIQENICDQRKLKNELQKQEKSLRTSYGGLMETLDTLKSLNNKLQREGHTLWSTLGQITGQKLTQPLVLRVLREQKSSLMKSGQEASVSLPQILHSCGICQESSDQHLLTQCDTCQRYYHLGCLDPPLTRMPRRSKNSYWQCSECDRSGSSSSDGDATAETLLDSMKRSRRQVREPIKFTQLPDSPSEDKKHLQKQQRSTMCPKKRCAIGKRRKRGRKRKAKEEEIEEEKPKVCPKPREPRHFGAKKPKAEEQQIQCTTCGTSGSSDTTVRCDQCTLNYHFGCLNPPLKKSPKQFGYGWICQDCDSTPSEAANPGGIWYTRAVTEDENNDEDQKEDENGAKGNKEESTSPAMKKSV